jgi:hypothetical protein
VSRRSLAAAWLLTAVFFGGLLVWGLASWRALDARGREAALERTRLQAAIKAKQDEVLRELWSQGHLREQQWSTERADPAVFLNGLAEMARGTRLRIVSIGPLEQTATPQFVKSSQIVQVTAPFADLKELVARIERDKGLLEDVALEVQREPARPRAPEAREIQARFKMTSMEVTGDAKRALQRALAVNRAGPGLPRAAETPSPLPPKAIDHAGRNPFAFIGPALAAAPKKPGPSPPAVRPPPPTSTAAAAPAPPSNPMTAAPRQESDPPTSTSPTSQSIPLAAVPARPAADAPMDVKGIISMPDGYLAIVNNSIVRTGDMVDNHRVEQITNMTVVLRRPDGETRVLVLPAAIAPSPDGAAR